MVDKSEPDWEVTRDLREYAWDWFSYHAGQRLTMFRFFLVVLGLFMVGFFTCLKDQNAIFAAVIAGVGMIASVVFYFLEMRNEHLVIMGKEALSVIEESSQFSMFDSRVKLVHSDSNRRLISTHKFWIRLFYIVCFLVFLAATYCAFREARGNCGVNLGRNVQANSEISSLPPESQSRQLYPGDKDTVSSSPSHLSDMPSMIQALATSIQAAVVLVGALVGGVWTWRLFVRNRLAYPRASVELSISHLPLVKNESRLVHVAVSIRNIGGVLLKSNCADLRLRQVVPIPEHLAGIADGNCDPVPEGHAEVDWPCLAARNWGKEHSFEIEPGEVDSLHADFVIPTGVSAVQFYFFILNTRKERERIGWAHTELYTFDNHAMEVAQMLEEKESPKSRLNEQQRQQKQQTQQQQKQQSSQGDQPKKKQEE